MAFLDYQRERTKERAKTRSENLSVFPIHDVPVAICRLAGDSQVLRQLAEKIDSKGVESVFPASVLVYDARGQMAIDLTILKDEKRWSELHKIPGAIEFLQMLDKDLLLSGGEAVVIAKFRENREKKSQEVASEMIAGLQKETDFNYELIGEATEHAFANEEEKSAYETLQTKIQEIVDRLFAVSGLTNFKPKAYLTRSKEKNAWIFNVGNNEATQEYLDQAKKSPTPLELPIFVHLGMFKLVETEDEMAGLLAHEFNHLLQPNFLGVEAEDTRQRLEYDADASGVRMADAAGYNPRGLIKLFEKLPKDNSILQKFGWGSHPDTERRITELEKEFNRTELPLPNAAKEFVAFSPEVGKALGTIYYYGKKPALVSCRGMEHTKAEQKRKEYLASGYLEEHHESSFILSPGIQSMYAEDAERKVRRVAVEQELAHGGLGYREILLDKLEDFLLRLKQRIQDPAVKRIFLTCPSYFSVIENKVDPGSVSDKTMLIGSLPETVLSVPRDDHYLGPKREIKPRSNIEGIRLERQKRIESLLKEVPTEVKESYQAGWKTKTIEDWIDLNNPATQPFWDEVARAYSEDNNFKSLSVSGSFNREERLYYLYRLLSQLMKKPPVYSSYSSNSNSFISVNHEIEKVESIREDVSVSIPKNENVLDKVQIGLDLIEDKTGIKISTRAAHRQEEKPPVKIKIKKVIPSSIEYKEVDGLSVDGPYLPDNLWNDLPENYPPVIQSDVAIVQEQTMLAYQEFLAEDGLKEKDTDIIRYVCARIFDDGFHEPNSSIHSPTNSGLSLRMAPEVSISFFDRAIKLLGKRKLDKFGEPIGNDATKNVIELETRQLLPLDGLRAAIAFGLVPETPEEAEIQNRYLREMALYKPSKQTITDLSSDKKINCNERYASTTRGGLEVRVYDGQSAAASELAWAESEKVIFDLMKGESSKGRLNQEALGGNEIRPEDASIVSEAVYEKFPVSRETVPKIKEEKLSFKKVKSIRGKKEIYQTELFKYLSRLPSVVRAYQDHHYQEGVLTKYGLLKTYANESSVMNPQQDHEIWYSLYPLMYSLEGDIFNRYGQEMIADLDMNRIINSDIINYHPSEPNFNDLQVKKLIKLVVQKIVRKSFFVSDSMKHARFVAVDSPALEQRKATSGFKYTYGESELDLFYEPGSSSKKFDKYSSRDVTKDNAIEYLTALSKDRPEVQTLIETLKKWPKSKSFPSELLTVCLGHFVEFQKDYYPYDKTNDDYNLYANTNDVITIWRQAAAVYGADWKNVEQYKSLDEQLSVWEWRADTAGLFEVKAKKDGDNVEFTTNQDAESLASVIESTFGDYLSRKYNSGSKETDVRFSWPLLMEDVWAGKVIFPVTSNTPTPTEHERKVDDWRNKSQLVIDTFRSELQRIVEDPKNLEKIKKMQAGFFREFLLEKKMERLNLQTLEEIEPWLEYFTSYPHEASSRNQVSGLIETARMKHREERKKELVTTALLEFLDDPSYVDYFSIVTRLTNDSLTDIDVEIKMGDGLMGYSKISNDTKKIEDEIQTINSGEGDAGKLSELEKKRDSLKKLERWSSHSMHGGQYYVCTRYQELIREAHDSATAGFQAKESDVMVFSDNIIENDQSRMEVGPVYRYRLAAQKLMDWHVDALRSAQTPEAVTSLFAKIEKIFPERHPLRDLYVKNQASVEAWNILRASLTPEEMASSGVSLGEKTVDLNQVLSQFPLYPEISFLKTYVLFEVKNLDKAVAQLPKDKAELILQKLETVITEQISPDQHNAVRRAFMQIEKIVRWPELRGHRRTDTRVFDEYLDRIISLYPEASFERDEILESINMDLAYTPEQIRKVEFLKYSEQMRWPKEGESKSFRSQHVGFEKMRGFLGMLNAAERTQYLIWFGGGPMPLAETLSAEKTHISLEDRKQAFWGLSPTERRNMMYDLCLGENGVMDNSKSSYYYSSQGKPWPVANYPEARVAYIANNLFEQAFGNNKINPDLPDDAPENARGRKMVQIIFREMLVGQPNAGRRTELLTNILEAMGSVQQEGRDLRVGELIRVLLEQIGVVGIKIGQLLSEQPGLLPEVIRQDLMQLKDRTPQFSKRGILTYLESAGWVKGDESKVAVIGDVLGSASIKQVQDGRLKDDREVAIKAKRPSIDKNYKDDLKVVAHVFKVLEGERYPVPSYLLVEVERVISEELSFINEAENQIAMGKSLRERSAQIDITFGEVTEATPLSVSTPLKVSEVFYPTPEQTVDIGLIVEEKVKGLSLKEIQAYQSALKSGNKEQTKVFQNKTIQLYGRSRAEEIESKISRMNIDKLQAELAIEFLRQVNKGGIFHADLHSGNFYIDFTPQVARGEVYNQQAFFIDLGSVGFSKREAMPDYVHKTTPENFNGAEHFRDFLSALFVNPPKSDKIAEVVNLFSGLSWDSEKVESLIGNMSESGEKVKKILYSILEEGKGKIDPQFRYFLKAFATAADHLTKLRDGVAAEFASMGTPEEAKATLVPKVLGEELLNVDMFF